MKSALRSLLRSPGYTITAVLTLTLGIGANIAMFSLVYTLLLQPAPYPRANELVRVYRTAAQSSSLPHSLPDGRDARGRNRALATLTAYSNWSYSLAEPGQPPSHLLGVTASADLFQTLQVQPVLGRAFTADEQLPGRDQVALLTFQSWRQRFDRDPNIVGRVLRMDGENVTVIGVMPETATYPLLFGPVEVWRPLKLSNDWRQNRDVYWLNEIGRLNPGVTLNQAQSELDRVAANLAQEFPGSNAGTGLRVLPLQDSVMRDTGKKFTWLTLSLAGLVLLIACANLANLQLARASANARAFAVRVALGASRRTLMADSLWESMLLALVGGGFGVLVARWLGQFLGHQITIGDEALVVSLNGWVLVFAFIISLLAGLCFGALPAWIAARSDVGEALKRQTRGAVGDRAQHRFRRGLVISEIVLTVILLSGAGLFLRGLQRFAQRDLGWRSNGLLLGTVTLPDNRYGDAEQRRLFHERLLQKLESIPGVEQSALASAVPISALNNAPLTVFVEGRPLPPPGQESLAHYEVVSSNFFATMQINLIAGRLFAADLRPGHAGETVVSETTARLLWPGENPLGKRISRTRDGQSWRQVIGVVRDVRFAADLGKPEAQMQIYEPLALDPWGYVTIALRGAAPATLAQPLRHAVAELDADLPVDALQTVGQSVEQYQHYFHFANQVLEGFAALGLLLSALGLYGLIAGMVTRRTAEFGLRIALGARTHHILSLVLGNGLRLTLLGVFGGIVGSIGLAQVLSSITPELPAQDPWAIALVCGLLIIVALLACYLPARRALKVDPVIALRSE